MKYEDMNKAQKLAVNRKCRKCKYSWTTGGTKAEPLCLYVLETEHQRGCDTDNCDKFVKRSGKRSYIGKERLW